MREGLELAGLMGVWRQIRSLFVTVAAVLGTLPWPAHAAPEQPDAAFSIAWQTSTMPQAEAPREAAPKAAPETAAATEAVVTGDQSRSTFRLALSKGVTAEIFTLPDPYRVVVDLPDLTFALPAGVGKTPTGLVKAFRYGLFAEGKARIVIDTDGPVRIEKAGMAAAAGSSITFTFDMVPVPAAAFGSGTGSAHAKPAPAPAAPEPTTPQDPNAKPVIVLDPGHGGIDGGAVGPSSVVEKTVSLAVAREVEKALAASGRLDVRMTRKTDVFVSLDRRLKFSREANSDLFVSLHADSLADTEFAGTVRGASVYTLSERASDGRAQRAADKENAADLLAGLSVSDAEGSDQVKGILFDLMKREAQNFSADFSKVLVKRMAGTLTMTRDPQRSAAFKVLRQAHAPSVLIELGYLSHAEDERLLASPAWQRKAAATIAAAIEAYFAKRTAGK